MLKKLSKVIKLIFIGTIWSYIYIYLANSLFVHFWKFNFLSAKQWRVIEVFWNSGGNIRQGKDYIFLLCLLLVIPLWMFGFSYFYKRNFLNLLLFPITAYNRRVVKKYGEGSKRIILKNLAATQKINMDDLVNQKLKTQPKIEGVDTSEVRSQIAEKIRSVK